MVHHLKLVLGHREIDKEEAVSSAKTGLDPGNCFEALGVCTAFTAGLREGDLDSASQRVA